MDDGHQLMLNRLSFELAERQRYVRMSSVPERLHLTSVLYIRLEQRRKELVAQKDDLQKQSKVKLTTIDSVKAQIDVLVKVGLSENGVGSS